VEGLAGGEGLGVDIVVDGWEGGFHFSGWDEF
jgi:hypothetical protein